MNTRLLDIQKGPNKENKRCIIRDMHKREEEDREKLKCRTNVENVFV